jgi:alanine dehydrogenase
MPPRIGIRREDKSVWERRVPITPQDARHLQEQHGLDVVVQPSEIRVFSDEEYRAAGVAVREDLSGCDVIFGIKEIPPAQLLPGKTYVFFAHVIKGQPYNMPMLRRLMELGCVLIDYEKVTDEKGRRLIFFGRHAGWAGMLDTLWALGRRLEWEGIPNPFVGVDRAIAYPDVEAARRAVRGGRRPHPPAGTSPHPDPAGGGIRRVRQWSPGARRKSLTCSRSRKWRRRTCRPSSRRGRTIIPSTRWYSGRSIWWSRSSPGGRFDLQEYYQHPERYRSRFAAYVPYLTVLVNGIYWEARYPRLVTKAYLRELFGAPARPRLRVIGDISCDIEGAVECTVRATDPGNPIYVYHPRTGRTTDGWAGEGVVVMAVDILPSEVPRDASVDFSAVLREFAPAIARADYTVPFEQLDLPPEIKRAVIVYRGELTPDYRYLEAYL